MEQPAGPRPGFAARPPCPGWAGAEQVTRKRRRVRRKTPAIVWEAENDIGNHQARRQHGRHADGRGYGLVLFASILLFVAGFFNMIYGIAAIANSHVFVANADYVIGDLRAWG